MRMVFTTKKGSMVSVSRRETIDKKLVGSVLRMTHTRIDLHFGISVSASPISDAILSETGFVSWTKRGIKLVAAIRHPSRKIVYRSPWSLVPSSPVEIASRLKLFASPTPKWRIMPL